MSNNSIAKLLKLSRRTVDYNVTKFCVTNSTKNRRGKTRKKTSVAEDKFIVNISLRNKRLTVPNITAEVNKSLKNPVSESTEFISNINVKAYKDDL